MFSLIKRIAGIQSGLLLAIVFVSVIDAVCSFVNGGAGLWIGLVDFGTLLMLGALVSPIVAGLVLTVDAKTRESLKLRVQGLLSFNLSNTVLSVQVVAGLLIAALFYKTNLSTYNYIRHAVRTTTYRGMLISLLAVGLAILLWVAWLWLSSVLSGLVRWLHTKSPKIAYIINMWTVFLLVLIGLFLLILMSKPLFKALKVIGWCRVFTLGLLFPLLFIVPLVWFYKGIKKIEPIVGLWVYYGLTLAFILLFVLANPSDADRAAIATGDLSSWCYQGLKDAFDFDGDGQMSLLGDGDCAPFNPNIFTGAPEIPGNGIDENCDGRDLKSGQDVIHAVWHYPVPSGFKPGNVVMITVDAWNPLRCSFNGYRRRTTPFLNKFIGKCVYFNAAFSQGPSTRLSFPSIFTSLFDPEIKRKATRRIPFELLPENKTLAEYMKALGFLTIAVLPTRYFTAWKGLTQGFDIVDSGAVRYWRRPSWHNGVQVARQAVKEMEKHRNKRVFMWVHVYDTHGPHVQPPHTRRFGRSEADRYDAEVLYVDSAIKTIVTAALKWLGKDTLFIITADHGESFDRRHRRKHHAADIYTTVVNVPLFFCSPAFVAGRREALVSLLDITPTLINLYGGRPDPGKSMRGSSLIPILFNAHAHIHDMVFQMMYLPEKAFKKQKALWWVGVVTDLFHMVWDLRHNAIQVFKWRKDIHDRQNIYRRNKGLFRPLVDALNLLIFQTMPSGHDKGVRQPGRSTKSKKTRKKAAVRPDIPKRPTQQRATKRPARH